jgi:hypothetical protein
MRGGGPCSRSADPGNDSYRQAPPHREQPFESPQPARVDVEAKGLAVKKPTGMLEIHGQSN